MGQQKARKARRALHAAYDGGSLRKRRWGKLDGLNRVPCPSPRPGNNGLPLTATASYQPLIFPSSPLPPTPTHFGQYAPHAPHINRLAVLFECCDPSDISHVARRLSGPHRVAHAHSMTSGARYHRVATYSVMYAPPPFGPASGGGSAAERARPKSQICGGPVRWPLSGPGLAGGWKRGAP